MTELFSKPCTAFAGHRLLSSGPLIEVALAVKTALQGEPAEPILAFDDTTGRVLDFDLRGTKADIIARLSQPPAAKSAELRRTDLPQSAEISAAEPRGRGRPKLGVVAREVTLLPRHWEWLSAQPGGASVTLRRLVDEARRHSGSKDLRRRAQEAAYRFMAAIAGDLPGFEEATRALFADDRVRFGQEIAGWPAEVGAYANKLAFGERG